MAVSKHQHLLFFRFRLEKYNFLRKKNLCWLNSVFPFILSVILYLWIRIRIHITDNNMYIAKYFNKNKYSSADNIPGYIPSQLLQKKSNQELHRQLCQRCYFIKEYNIALKVILEVFVSYFINMRFCQRFMA